MKLGPETNFLTYILEILLPTNMIFPILIFFETWSRLEV